MGFPPQKLIVAADKTPSPFQRPPMNGEGQIKPSLLANPIGGKSVPICNGKPIKT